MLRQIAVLALVLLGAFSYLPRAHATTCYNEGSDDLGRKCTWAIPLWTYPSGSFSIYVNDGGLTYSSHTVEMGNNVYLFTVHLRCHPEAMAMYPAQTSGGEWGQKTEIFTVTAALSTYLPPYTSSVTADAACTGPNPKDLGLQSTEIAWIWVERPVGSWNLCNVAWAYGGVCTGDYFDPYWNQAYLP